MPLLSVLNLTCPDFAFLIASETLSVTVPVFGFGISPFGPKTWPSLPTTFIAACVEITTSTVISFFVNFSLKSSMPIKSAPADFASSAASPSAKTATTTSFPRELGSVIAPRTF